jgi:predicted flap endonuclease-1-like 5' DNA nuclease
LITAVVLRTAALNVKRVVLLVDGDGGIKFDVQALVRILGFETTALEWPNVAPALRLVQEKAAALLVLIATVKFQGHALQLIQQIRSYDAALPVFLIASGGSEELVTSALRLQVTDYFKASVEQTEFEARFKRVCGNQASSSSCYCCCCETQTRMRNPTPTTTPGGKPATTGTCSQCGATVTTTGGQLTPGLTAIPATFTYTHSTVPVTTEQLVAVIERLQTSSGQVAKAQLSQITGIGPARASQLQAAGISTLRQLADATKETVAAILERPGMSLDLAQSFIDQATKLLEEGHPT